MRIRLDISYLGSSFLGFQSQPHGQTVQDELQKALGIFYRRPVKIVGASRTDAGVHAEHQVVSFEEEGTALSELPYALTSLMKHRVVVLRAQEVPDEFHPIYSSKGKIYRYRLFCSKLVDPFLKPFVHEISQIANLKKMAEELAEFKGVHNFKSFCASDSGAKSFERRIIDVKLEARGPLVNIWIHGEGFLKQMIRSMIGTLLAIDRGKLSSVKEILAREDRPSAGPTAPAKGLCLVRVLYADRDSIADEIQRADQFFTAGGGAPPCFPAE